MAASRIATVAVGVTALVAAAGCDNLSHRRLDFTDTEPVRVTSITVLPGAGDVTVHTASVSQLQIKRVVRYHGAQPTTKHRVEGSNLILDTECGQGCTVSYEVLAPKGVNVRGETGSGDITLSRVGTVEVRVGSGDVTVDGATGPVKAESGSGGIEVSDVTGVVTLRTSSGDITGRGLVDTVDVEAASGDVNLDLDKPASVRAYAASGSVQLVVPGGRYRVRQQTGSGDVNIGVQEDPAASLLLDLGTGSGDIRVIQR